MIIALFGEVGTGRSKIANYLAEQHGFAVLSLEKIVKRVRRRIIKSNLSGAWINLMVEITHELDKEISKKQKQDIVIDDIPAPLGIYQMVYDWAKENGYLSVYVTCDKDERIERLVKRDGSVKAKNLVSHDELVLKGIRDSSLKFEVIYHTSHNTPAKLELFWNLLNQLDQKQVRETKSA